MTIPANRLQLDQAAQTLADVIADPAIIESASDDEMDRLLAYWDAVVDARDQPPQLCAICGSIAGAEGTCLDLLDAEPGILRDQCLTGVFGSGPLECVSIDPITGQEISCEDWWANVSSMLGNAGQLLRQLGRPDQAEVLFATGEATSTPLEQSHASREFTWPDWAKENKGWIWLVGIALAFRISGVGRQVTVQRRPAKRKPAKRKKAS